MTSQTGPSTCPSEPADCPEGFNHPPPLTPGLSLGQCGNANEDAGGAVDVQLQGAALGPSGTKRLQALPEEGIQRYGGLISDL